MSPPFPVEWSSAQRAQAFASWFAPLCAQHALDAASLRPASADASFRRYLRVSLHNASGADREGRTSCIVMDAPPPQEDVRPFVDIARRLHAAGVVAPEVLAADTEHGFVLLSDLGSRLLLRELQAAEAAGRAAMSHTWMLQATESLVQMQLKADSAGLPSYDDALLQRELDLFPTWCVEREKGIAWTPAQHQTWAQSCARLKAQALGQATVFVHRDYMPRNLMVLGDASGRAGPGTGLGILDFQDAVRGPITYDIASLLRDAFWSWDEEREIDWAVRYWERARKAGLPVNEDFGGFWRDLEWMGLQRHLKVLGIFCRLKHRDGKAAYAEDLPRFFGYAHKVATRYQGLGGLAALIEQAAGTQRQAGYTF